MAYLPPGRSPKGRSPKSGLLSQPPETPEFTPIGNTLTVPKFTPQEYKPVTGGPVNVRSTEDVLNDITASDSKYIQQARQSGMETGAARGLLNSSMSAGAAERAAIESALPIAQQDAGYTQDLGRTRAQEEASSRLAYQDYTQSGSLAEYDNRAKLNLSYQDYLQQGSRDEYGAKVGSSLSAQEAHQRAVAAQKDAKVARQAAKDLAETQRLQIEQKGEIDFALKDKEIEALVASAERDHEYAMELQATGASQQAIENALARADDSRLKLTLAEMERDSKLSAIDAQGEINFALKDKEIEALMASAERDHEYAMELQATGASQQAIENALARADDSRLKLTLAEMERDSKLSAIDAQGKIDAGRDQVKIDADKDNLDTEIKFKKWVEESQQAGATLRANTELVVKERINNANITSAERTSAMNAIVDAGLQYSVDVQNILRDPNLDEAAKRAGYANATTTYEKNIAHIMGILGGSTSGPVDTTPVDTTQDFTPTESKVNARYNAVFGRDGDVEGIKYWADQIEDPNNPVTLQNLDSYLEPFKEKEEPKPGNGLLTGNDDVPDNSNGLLTGKEIDPKETPEEKEDRVYQEKQKDWDPMFQPGGEYELYGRYAASRDIRPTKRNAQTWMDRQPGQDRVGK